MLFIATSASSIFLQISTSCSRVSKGTLPIWFIYIRTGSSRISRRESSSASSGCWGCLAAFGAFGLGLVHDDFHVKAAQLAQQRVQIVGAQIVRQNVVDVIVGDVAVFLAEMHERLDRLGQIHRGLRRAGSGRARLAVCRSFLRRRLNRGGRVLGLCRSFPAAWPLRAFAL